MTPPLTVINVGRMWQVQHLPSRTTLAFACTYTLACCRARELKRTGAAARTLRRRGVA